MLDTFLFDGPNRRIYAEAAFYGGVRGLLSNPPVAF